MGLREMRTYWPSSIAGLACGLTTGAGLLLGAFTDRRSLAAVLIVVGFFLLVVTVLVAMKFRKVGDPF